MQEIDPESESGEEELQKQMDLINANPAILSQSLRSSKHSAKSDKKYATEAMSIDVND